MTMNNFDEALSKAKSCFGKYEEWDCSWHCVGCTIKEECKHKKEENDDETK